MTSSRSRGLTSTAIDKATTQTDRALTTRYRTAAQGGNPLRGQFLSPSLRSGARSAQKLPAPGWPPCSGAAWADYRGPQGPVFQRTTPQANLNSSSTVLADPDVA